MPDCIDQQYVSAPQLTYTQHVLTYTQFCIKCAVTCQITDSLWSLHSSQKKAQCFVPISHSLSTDRHISIQPCRTMLHQTVIITKCVTVRKSYHKVWKPETDGMIRWHIQSIKRWTRETRCDVIPCWLVERCNHSTGTCNLQLQGARTDTHAPNHTVSHSSRLQSWPRPPQENKQCSQHEKFLLKQKYGETMTQEYGHQWHTDEYLLRVTGGGEGENGQTVHSPAVLYKCCLIWDPQHHKWWCRSPTHRKLC